MIRLRTTFVRGGKILSHRDTKHVTYRAAKEHWFNDVDYFGPDYKLFGAFWRGRKCLSLKTT